jgi:hypothetical protein
MFRENNTLTSCIAHKVMNNHEKGARVHGPHDLIPNLHTMMLCQFRTL